MRVKGAKSGVYGCTEQPLPFICTSRVFNEINKGLSNNTGGLILGKCSSHEFEFPYVPR
jgi:hypothetical protein